jgi:hypothetical protein
MNVAVNRRRAATELLLAFATGLFGCATPSAMSRVSDPIVGAWLVKDPNAPFPYHLYVFNADGTMQQANPDAGDAHGSDSDGKGIWRTSGTHVAGKWVEVVADRATHMYAGRLEISFEITVNGDAYTGTETVRSYDAAGNLTASPATPEPLVGKRVTLP